MSQGLLKILGADIELGNFILTSEGAVADEEGGTMVDLDEETDSSGQHDGGNKKRRHIFGRRQSHSGYSGGSHFNFFQTSAGDRASRILLNAVDAVDASKKGGYNPQDRGRKWLSNGSCVYIDMNHLEICLPEVTNAWDFCAAYRAQLQIAENARVEASRDLRPGETLHLIVRNTDGSGSSWGGHINVLLTRDCWTNIFQKRLHYLLWLASYQASSIIIHGQGKVGSENGREHVPYQISQRADYMETMLGDQTTYKRPLINSRDEALVSTQNKKFARFHHIACDSNLCDYAVVLKVGILQLVLAMVEQNSEFIQLGHLLQEPVSATIAYSHDPDLNIAQPRVGGPDITALESQYAYLAQVEAFVATGAANAVVPRAAEIVSMWRETLDMLNERDWESLAGRLDWVLKRQLLEEFIETNGVDWADPQVARLDLNYGSMNPADGIFLSLENAGYVEKLITPEEVDHFMIEPPTDTRAYTRGNIINMYPRSSVGYINWDEMIVYYSGPRGGKLSKTIKMDDPTKLTQEDCGQLFADLENTDLDDEGFLEAVAAFASPSSATTGVYRYQSWN